MDEETEQEGEVEQEGSLQELPQESLQQEDKQTVNIDTGVFSLLNPYPQEVCRYQVMSAEKELTEAGQGH